MKSIKKTPAIGLALLLLAVTYSCKDGSTEAENFEEKASPVLEEAVESASATSDAKEATSSVAAAEPKNSKRKVIRTADIKFKVKNVPKTTYAIEDATTKFGGFVTYTNLESKISYQDETKVSPDSTLITTKYTVENNITIRVPNTRLDTVIKTIAKQIDFLDYRLIKADDVTLQLLANQMAQNRSTNSGRRIEKAIDNKGTKLNSIIDAEDRLENKKSENDAAKIENLSVNEQVNFSSLTLQIYQRESVKQEMVANEKNINTYRPNIGLQIWDSFKTGWFMLENIIAFIVQLWGLALIAVLSFFNYKRFYKK